MAGFLESDLQDSPTAAREVLRALDAVESGREPSWERTGNAYTLTLSPEGATIQDENDEDSKPRPFSLAALREAVAGWVSFLERGNGLTRTYTDEQGQIPRPCSSVSVRVRPCPCFFPQLVCKIGKSKLGSPPGRSSS